MLELPEVETVTRGLRLAILGRRILSVALAKTDFIDDPVALEAHLPGRRIEAVERFGKFMFLRLSGATEAGRARRKGGAGAPGPGSPPLGGEPGVHSAAGANAAT